MAAAARASIAPAAAAGVPVASVSTFPGRAQQQHMPQLQAGTWPSAARSRSRSLLLARRARITAATAAAAAAGAAVASATTCAATASAPAALAAASLPSLAASADADPDASDVAATPVANSVLPGPACTGRQQHVDDTSPPSSPPSSSSSPLPCSSRAPLTPASSAVLRNQGDASTSYGMSHGTLCSSGRGGSSRSLRAPGTGPSRTRSRTRGQIGAAAGGGTGFAAPSAAAAAACGAAAPLLPCPPSVSALGEAALTEAIVACDTWRDLAQLLTSPAAVLNRTHVAAALVVLARMMQQQTPPPLGGQEGRSGGDSGSDSDGKADSQTAAVGRPGGHRPRPSALWDPLDPGSGLHLDLDMDLDPGAVKSKGGAAAQGGAGEGDAAMRGQNGNGAVGVGAELAPAYGSPADLATDLADLALTQYLPYMSAREVANVTWALARLKPWLLARLPLPLPAPLPPHPPRLRQPFSPRAAAAVLQAACSTRWADFKDQELTVLLYGITVLEPGLTPPADAHRTGSWLATWFAVSERRLASLGPRGLTVVLWALSQLWRRPLAAAASAPIPTVWAARLRRRLASQLPHIYPAALVQVAWGLARLQPWLMSAEAHGAAAEQQMDPAAAATAEDVAVPELLAVLTRAAIRKAPQVDSLRDLAQLSWAIGKLQESIWGPRGATEAATAAAAPANVPGSPAVAAEASAASIAAKASSTAASAAAECWRLGGRGAGRGAGMLRPAAPSHGGTLRRPLGVGAASCDADGRSVQELAPDAWREQQRPASDALLQGAAEWSWDVGPAAGWDDAARAEPGLPLPPLSAKRAELLSLIARPARPEPIPIVAVLQPPPEPAADAPDSSGISGGSGGTWEEQQRRHPPRPPARRMTAPSLPAPLPAQQGYSQTAAQGPPQDAWGPPPQPAIPANAQAQVWTRQWQEEPQQQELPDLRHHHQQPQQHQLPQGLATLRTAPQQQLIPEQLQLQELRAAQPELQAPDPLSQHSLAREWTDPHPRDCRADLQVQQQWQQGQSGAEAAATAAVEGVSGACRSLAPPAAAAAPQQHRVLQLGRAVLIRWQELCDGEGAGGGGSSNSSRSVSGGAGSVASGHSEQLGGASVEADGEGAGPPGRQRQDPGWLRREQCTEAATASAAGPAAASVQRPSPTDVAVMSWACFRLGWQPPLETVGRWAWLAVRRPRDYTQQGLSNVLQLVSTRRELKTLTARLARLASAGTTSAPKAAGGPKPAGGTARLCGGAQGTSRPGPGPGPGPGSGHGHGPDRSLEAGGKGRRPSAGHSATAAGAATGAGGGAAAMTARTLMAVARARLRVRHWPGAAAAVRRRPLGRARGAWPRPVGARADVDSSGTLGLDPAVTGCSSATNEDRSIGPEARSSASGSSNSSMGSIRTSGSSTNRSDVSDSIGSIGSSNMSSMLHRSRRDKCSSTGSSSSSTTGGGLSPADLQLGSDAPETSRVRTTQRGRQGARGANYLRGTDSGAAAASSGRLRIAPVTAAAEPWDISPASTAAWTGWRTIVALLPPLELRKSHHHQGPAREDGGGGGRGAARGRDPSAAAAAFAEDVVVAVAAAARLRIRPHRLELARVHSALLRLPAAYEPADPWVSAAATVDAPGAGAAPMATTGGQATCVADDSIATAVPCSACSSSDGGGGGGRVPRPLPGVPDSKLVPLAVALARLQRRAFGFPSPPALRIARSGGGSSGGGAGCGSDAAAVAVLQSQLLDALVLRCTALTRRHRLPLRDLAVLGWAVGELTSALVLSEEDVGAAASPPPCAAVDADSAAADSQLPVPAPAAPRGGAGAAASGCGRCCSASAAMGDWCTTWSRNVSSYNVANAPLPDLCALLSAWAALGWPVDVRTQARVLGRLVPELPLLESYRLSALSASLESLAWRLPPAWADWLAECRRSTGARPDPAAAAAAGATTAAAPAAAASPTTVGGATAARPRRAPGPRGPELDPEAAVRARRPREGATGPLGGRRRVRPGQQPQPQHLR